MPTQKRERKRQGRQVRQEYLQAQRRKAKLRRQAMVVLIAVALVLGAALFFSRDSGDEVATTTTTTAALVPKAEPVATDTKITGDTPCPPADGSATPTYAFEKAPTMCLDPAKTYVAKLTTTEGVIEITLDTKKTPKTANNFAVLSRYHYYDGTSLFRTNTGIDIIQGGSPHTQQNDDPGPGYTIEDEGTGFKYTEGDFVMARTSQPNSASAQFFFAAGARTSALDDQGTYVTFGKVTAGTDVMKDILGLHRDDPAQGQPGEGGPSKLVVIEKIEILER